MTIREHSICLFCSYFTGPEIPDYVRVYLIELKRHFKEVLLLTNEKQLSPESQKFLEADNIGIRLYENEGYDFGMWSKALNEPEINKYQEIALVNDSCVLFRSLDDVMKNARNSEYDYCGLISSNQVEWHIQSFFIIRPDTVLNDVRAYFNQHGFKDRFEDVIISYEVGLCSYLLSRNYRLGTLFSVPNADPRLNPSFKYIDVLIRNGYPLIKKKLLAGTYRNEEIRGLLIRNFNFDPGYYIQLIRASVKNPLIAPESLQPQSAAMQLKISALRTLTPLLSLPFSLLRKIKSKEKTP
jgi:hypothetical protein